MWWRHEARAKNNALAEGGAVRPVGVKPALSPMGEVQWAKLSPERQAELMAHPERWPMCVGCKRWVPEEAAGRTFVEPVARVVDPETGVVIEPGRTQQVLCVFCDLTTVVVEA